jgi:hypothetical protein
LHSQLGNNQADYKAGYYQADYNQADYSKLAITKLTMQNWLVSLVITSFA